MTLQIRDIAAKQLTSSKGYTQQLLKALLDFTGGENNNKENSFIDNNDFFKDEHMQRSHTETTFCTVSIIGQSAAANLHWHYVVSLRKRPSYSLQHNTGLLEG